MSYNHANYCSFYIDKLVYEWNLGGKKITWDRQALQDEIKYGMLTLGLPVIVIYPNIKNESDIARWDSLVLIQNLYGTNYLHSEII